MSAQLRAGDSKLARVLGRHLLRWTVEQRAKGLRFTLPPVELESGVSRGALDVLLQRTAVEHLGVSVEASRRRPRNAEGCRAAVLACFRHADPRDADANLDLAMALVKQLPEITNIVDGQAQLARRNVAVRLGLGLQDDHETEVLSDGELSEGASQSSSSSSLAGIPPSPLLTGEEPESSSSTLAFRVGDVVRHKLFGFRGVVSGWDPLPVMDVAGWNGVRASPRATAQPFYNVIPDSGDLRYTGSRVQTHERYCAEDNLAPVSSSSEARISNPLIPYFFEDFVPASAHETTGPDGDSSAQAQAVKAGQFLPCEAMLDLYPSDWDAARLSQAAHALVGSPESVACASAARRVAKAAQKLGTELGAPLNTQSLLGEGATAEPNEAPASSSSSSLSHSAAAATALNSVLANLQRGLDGLAVDTGRAGRAVDPWSLDHKPLRALASSGVENVTAAADDEQPLTGAPQATEADDEQPLDYARKALFWGRSDTEGSEARCAEEARVGRRLAYQSLRSLVRVDSELQDLLAHRRRTRGQTHPNLAHADADELEFDCDAPVFVVGEVVRHKQFGYRGVVVHFDPRASIDVKGWDGLRGLSDLPGPHQGLDPAELPFYSVYIDEADEAAAFKQGRAGDGWVPHGVRYVAQANLESLAQAAPPAVAAEAESDAVPAAVAAARATAATTTTTTTTSRSQLLARPVVGPLPLRHLLSGFDPISGHALPCPRLRFQFGPPASNEKSGEQPVPSFHCRAPLASSEVRAHVSRASSRQATSAAAGTEDTVGSVGSSSVQATSVVARMANGLEDPETRAVALALDGEETRVFGDLEKALEMMDRMLHSALSNFNSSTNPHQGDSGSGDDGGGTLQLSDVLLLLEGARSEEEASAAEACVRLMLSSHPDSAVRSSLAEGSAHEKRRSFGEALKTYDDLLFTMQEQGTQKHSGSDDDPSLGYSKRSGEEAANALEAEVRARCASVSFLRGHYGAARVQAKLALVLEPRHVGARAGLALCEEALMGAPSSSAFTPSPPPSSSTAQLPIGGSGALDDDGEGPAVKSALPFDGGSGSSNGDVGVEAACEALEAAVAAIPWASSAGLWPRLNKVRGVADQLRRASTTFVK